MSRLPKFAKKNKSQAIVGAGKNLLNPFSLGILDRKVGIHTHS
jgi:hypothetical protein